LILILAALALLPGCSRKEANEAEDPMAEGWSAFQLAEYPRAHQAFQTAAKQAAPGTEEEARVLFAQATLSWHELPQPNRSRARELFEKVAAMAPQSDLAPWSLLSIARIEALPRVADIPKFTQEGRESAIAAYERVITAYPTHPAAEEALVLQQAMALASLETADCNTAIERLTRFLSEKPNSRYRSHAWAVLAMAYDLLERWPERLNAMIQSLNTIEIDPSNPLAIKSFHYWSIASLAEYKVGDLRTAREYYTKLIDKFPHDLLTYSCKLALQRLDRLEAGAPHQSFDNPPSHQ
jgi:tetratricopeptide (TPR) repeat protein